MFSVGMHFLLRLLDGGIGSRKAYRRQNNLGEQAHARMTAITLPFIQGCNARIARVFLPALTENFVAIR
jgi:hypothetical protein